MKESTVYDKDENIIAKGEYKDINEEYNGDFIDFFDIGSFKKKK